MAKKITILAAIIFSSALLKELYHEHSIGVWFFDNKQFFEDLNPSILIMSGMLSGIGSILGGGGLFGHGLCGVPRFSGRSIFATILMAIAAVYTNKEKFASIIIKNTEGKIDF